jgi:DNA invertase Pin-like site-specific DNA recombinase
MTRKRKRTAIYVRVSTARQELAGQCEDLRRWAEANGVDADWYEDKASGTTMDRPGWSRLWARVQSLDVDRVVVWRLDRLGRTAAGLMQLIEDLDRLGVGLVSLRESFDLGTSPGRLMARVLASMAQFETEMRRERQAAGIAAARAAGKHIGRAKGTGKPLKVTPDRAELVRRLKREGVPVAAIARRLDLSRSSVYAALAGDQAGARE